MNRISIFVCLSIAAVLQGSALAAPVSFASLLEEMTNLDLLTRLPAPAYTCKQFSSYDRRSTDPSVLTDENWFANGDRGQYLRTEERNGEKEYVLMDAEGPGAIVRFWSADPNDAGLCRIYLDNAEAPVIEVSLEDYLGGKTPLAPEPIACTLAKGWNSYLPIPYAKHCKVTTSKPDFYYHLNYRTYTPGTKVKTYTPEAAAKQAEKIQEVAKALAAPEQKHDNPHGRRDNTPYKLSLTPGLTAAIELEDGPAQLIRFTCRVKAEDVAAALRACLLEITFDKQPPSVQTPLGDFFSTAPGLNTYQALPLGVLEDGTLYCHWRMPYQKRATIRLTNYGSQPVELEGATQTQARRWSKDSLYFHAEWRTAQDLKTQPRQDWTFLDAHGAGRFVGVMLHMANPVAHWWGEGDEKIYFDGEKFPSTFGTGSEDYFGYAWCDPTPFTHAYHAQPRCDGPGNYGHTLVNRFHILDDIPFTQNLKFDLEVWHWADTQVTQSAVAWWYGTPGSTSTATKPDPAKMVVPVIPPLPEPKRVEGALEGEKLKVLGSTGGEVTTQSSATWEWSGGEQLWWTHAQAGQTLDLEVGAPEAGNYEIVARFTKAPDYALAQASLNDQVLGAPLDFYATGVEAVPEISLGVVPLKAGPNTLRFEIKGANPAALPGNMVGLDYLVLKKQ